MDHDRLLLSAKNLLSDIKEFKKKTKSDITDDFHFEMEIKYPYLKQTSNTIFNLTIKDKLDINMLTYMVNQAKAIKKQKLTNEQASINVGEKLVKKFVKN